MADHYVSLNRGVQGFKYSDFTTGTSTTAGDGIELRVLDGASFTKKDVLVALEAFERFFENAQQVSAAGFDVSG
jgi:hypothetical protein